MEDDSKAQMLNIKTTDGEVFRVEVLVAKKSITLRDMMENIIDLQSDEPVSILVNSKTFKKVIEWSKHHVNDPTEEENVKKRSEDPWDAEFINELNVLLLFDLVHATNYLNIPDLFDCCCKSVANMIKGHTPEATSELIRIMRRNI